MHKFVKTILMGRDSNGDPGQRQTTAFRGAQGLAWRVWVSFVVDDDCRCVSLVVVVAVVEAVGMRSSDRR